MPKAAMNENYSAPPREDEVRLAGQVFSMQAISISKAKGKFTNCHFWTRILCAYFRHHGASLGFVVYVCHGLG